MQRCRYGQLIAPLQALVYREGHSYSDVADSVACSSVNHALSMYYVIYPRYLPLKDIYPLKDLSISETLAISPLKNKWTPS